MKYKIIIIALLCFSISSHAQRNKGPKTEDVSVAKKLKALYKKEEIVLLSKKVTVTFQKNKKEGLVAAVTVVNSDYLNIGSRSVLQHPVFYDTESVVNNFIVTDRESRALKPYSYTIVDEYLKNKDLFHTAYRVKFVTLKFPLQGSRFKTVTEKTYKDVKYYTSEFFVDGYRIKKGSLTVIIPNWLDLELKEFNFELGAVSKKVTKNKEETIITYSYDNVAPRNTDANAPGPSLIFPHVLFIAKSHTDEGVEKRLFKDVTDLFAWYNGLVKNIKIDASVYKSKVQELIEGTTTDEEKLKNIFYWIQDNIRYIAFEDGIAGFKPDSPQNVFLKRYGDCKGMAILMKYMLKEAGFKSHLVWIGTDRLGYDYSTPSLAVDNHMICSIDLNDEIIFLDGTEKYNRYGDYASRIQNKQALIETGDSYKIVTVPEASQNTNLDKTKYALSLLNETITGVVTRTYSGESRVQFQNRYTTFGSDEQDNVLSNYLTAGNDNIEITAVDTFDVENRDSDLALAYSVEIKNAVSEFDGIIYVDIDPIKQVNQFFFKDRKVDYLFPMKEFNETEITLEIPSGYSLGELPESLAISNPLIDIDVSYKVDGATISFLKSIAFKNRTIKKDQFELWNDSFKQLKENLNEQITFIKH